MRLMCLPDDFPKIPRTKASKKLFSVMFLYYIIRIQQIKEKNTSTVNLYSVNI